MSKLGEQELATELRDKLVFFLRQGTINEQQVTRTLDVTDLDIENMDRLKRIHFCLSDPVIGYVDALQDRLRRIKTANQRERVNTRGEIRGEIDWEQTLKHRYSDSIGDRSRFTCDTPYTEYDIPENLVLKKLLWTIHSTVESDLSQIEYAWRTDKWTEDRIFRFSRLYNRNVHVSRIADGRDITVTPRILNQTRLARQQLYTDAYELYNRYQRLLANGDDEDVQQLLRDTLVIPERLPRLFELFCVFKVLDGIHDGGFRYQVIEPGAEHFAKLETESNRITVYHDRTGSLDFYVPLDEMGDPQSEFFRRYRNTLERHQKLVDRFLDIDSRPSLYSGRPDIVIEIYDKADTGENLVKVVLGEIKYTNNAQTFSTGLKELLEYIEYAQRAASEANQYLDEEGISIEGLIVTDGVETAERAPIDGKITHITAENLKKSESPTEWAPQIIER